MLLILGDLQPVPSREGWSTGQTWFPTVASKSAVSASNSTPERHPVGGGTILLTAALRSQIIPRPSTATLTTDATSSGGIVAQRAIKPDAVLLTMLNSSGWDFSLVPTIL
jgi:hypothetical protein